MKTIVAPLAFVLFAGMLGAQGVPVAASTAASYTIWEPSTMASPFQAVNDSGSVEVGVKFRSEIAGSVTGVRFYKGPGNTGPHIGNLWSATGSRLASGTFTNETVTGWQQLAFAAPVSINPGVTYVASYFAPAGHYAYASGYFAGTGMDNPPLHALPSGVDGGNGVFAYGTVSTFPVASFSSSNYWVDVVFNAIVTTPPRVTSESPAPAAGGVPLNPEVTAGFSEAVLPSSVGFTLTDPTGANVPATVVYELYGQTRAVTLEPNGYLAPATTYAATVTGATDRARNMMAAPASWSFTTTATTSPPPATAGQWRPDQRWPIVALHSVVLPTGNVLQWDLQGPGSNQQIWNPDANTFTTSALVQSAWRAGHVQLADGRVLGFGGTVNNGPSSRAASIYDPATNVSTSVADLHLPRWYPAGVRLGDGRVIIIGGQISDTTWANTPEVYDPASNTWTLLTAVSTADVHEDLYPASYLLPNGKILVYAGSTGQTRLLDVATQTWTPGPTSPIFNGSSAMYAPGKLIASGGTAVPISAHSAQGLPLVAQAATLDMTAPAPTWQMVSPMNFARGYHNLVTLPDGTVLAVGGSTTFSTTSSAGVLSAETWNPPTGRWTTMAQERDPRMNQSTAVLLPDGTVLAAGGGHAPGFAPADYFTAEIYRPAYLFKTTPPQISSAPTSAGNGATIAVTTPTAGGIATVALMGLSAQSRTYTAGGSFVPLSFATTPTGLNVTIPSSTSVAPPGYYMLFLVDGKGVPSRAQLIQIGWPGISNTGVPRGTTLTPYAGSLTITQPGTVIDALDINGGCISIQASNVTIKRSRVRATACGASIINATTNGRANLSGVTIQDVEVDGGNFDPNAFGIEGGGFTCLRCNIHNVANGFHVYGTYPITIQDSYVHDLYIRDDLGTHNQDLYDGGFAPGLTIRHNTLENWDGQTGTISLFGDTEPVQNTTIDDNLLAGGGWSFYGGSSCPKPFCTQTRNIVVTNNRWSRKFFPNGGLWGPVSDYDLSRPGNAWSGNVWDDTGVPVVP